PFDLASAQTLAATDVDEYTVTVNVTVNSSAVPADAWACSTMPFTPKHGLYNAATVTAGGYSATAVNCGDVPQPPKPTIATTVKSVSQNADGAWVVVYDLDVANTSNTWSAPYDLADTIAFGGNITVTGRTVQGPVGLTLNPTWNGGVGTPADSTVVSGVIAENTTLHFTVTVTATVHTAASAKDLDCQVTGTEAGTGFLNTAIVKSGTNSDQAQACATPVKPEITKAAGTPQQHLVAGAWD